MSIAAIQVSRWPHLIGWDLTICWGGIISLDGRTVKDGIIVLSKYLIWVVLNSEKGLLLNKTNRLRVSVKSQKIGTIFRKMAIGLDYLCQFVTPAHYARAAKADTTCRTTPGQLSHQIFLFLFLYFISEATNQSGWGIRTSHDNSISTAHFPTLSSTIKKHELLSKLPLQLISKWIVLVAVLISICKTIRT